MLKASWKSRGKYFIKGHVGRIAFLDRPNHYVLVVGPKDTIYDVDQAEAKRIRDVEDRANRTMGRPSHFPGQKLESKLITLPADLWNKIGDPPSVYIARMYDADK